MSQLSAIVEEAQMEQDALSKFGSILMQRVRDRAIGESDMIIEGRMRGRLSEATRLALSELNDQQRSVIYELVPEIVDRTLHHLLWTLDQERDLSVAVQTDAGVVPDLVSISDGLDGELYEWRRNFSSERYNEIDDVRK